MSELLIKPVATKNATIGTDVAATRFQSFVVRLRGASMTYKPDKDVQMQISVESIGDAIKETLSSPNVSDQNLEPANVVDVISDLANSAGKVANAITAPASGGTDASGVHVESLTEAVMGVTGGLHAIANAIEALAAKEQAMR